MAEPVFRSLQFGIDRERIIPVFHSRFMHSRNPAKVALIARNPLDEVSLWIINLSIIHWAARLEAGPQPHLSTALHRG